MEADADALRRVEAARLQSVVVGNVRQMQDAKGTVRMKMKNKDVMMEEESATSR